MPRFACTHRAAFSSQPVQQCPEIHPQYNFCPCSSPSWNCLLFVWQPWFYGGVCDDNNTRAYITLCISQALRRPALFASPGHCQAGRLERLIGNPDPRRGGQEGGQRGSEAGPSRPPAPPAPPEVREIRNNDSRPREEEGSPAAALSLLLCVLPVPRAGSLDRTWKAAFVSMMLCFFFHK